MKVAKGRVISEPGFVWPAEKYYYYLVWMPLSYLIYGSGGLLVITLIVYFVNLRKRK